jgi:hypothetical protein
MSDNTVGSLSGTQHALIIGSLLGDGAMRCKANALLEINHCLEQQAYVDWKYQHLADLVKTPPKARTGNGSRIAYRFTTLSLPRLTPYYRAFYSGGQKVVPDVRLEPLSLAVWFMDDGCKSHRAVYLNTQQFSVENQFRLVGMLKEQWEIDATLNQDKHYYRLRIAVASVSRFKTIVSPHLLEQFAYKFPEMTP